MTSRRFPPGFLLGAATAAYQIEGAWDADGKGESIWDRFLHDPARTAKVENGDTACDSYHRFAEDIGLMKEIGLNAYRFSISWPRVMPSGKGRVEQRGIDYYARLTDGLLAAGIEPFATLFHWDMPAALWDSHKGWMSRDVARYFGDYAALMYERLGDRVTHWITHNEPRVHVSGYAGTGSAPGYGKGPEASVVAEHNILVSHALAVQAFRASGKQGAVGITLSMGNARPLGDTAADGQAAMRAVEHDVYWNLDAIYRGSYPSLARQGQVNALLPRGWETDCAFAREQGSDFIGVNHYRINWAEHDASSPFGYRFVYDRKRVPCEETTGIGWPVVPEGMYETLKLVGERYPGVPIYVTENGYADSIPASQAPRVHDPERISFLERYMGSALRAAEEGVPLKGYFVWSLLDNLEWGHYDPRFGLIAVDFRTPALERTLKDSAQWLHRVIANGSL